MLSARYKAFIIEACKCLVHIRKNECLNPKRTHQPDIDYFLWVVGLAKRECYNMETHEPIGAFSYPALLGQYPKIAESQFLNANGLYEYFEDVGSAIDFRMFKKYDTFDYNPTLSRFEHSIFPWLISKLKFYGIPEKLIVSRNKTFRIESKNLKSLLNSMVAEGYAEAAGDGYKWTDKMAKPMICAFLWDESELNRIPAERLEGQVDKLFKVSQEVPFLLTDRVAILTPLGLAAAIIDRWDGKHWQKFKLVTPALTLDETYALAEMFHEKYIWNGRKWIKRNSIPLCQSEREFLVGLAKGIYYLYLDASSERKENPKRFIHDYLQRSLREGLDFLWRAGLCKAQHESFPTPIFYSEFKEKYWNSQKISFLSLTFYAAPKNEIDTLISFDEFEQMTPYTPDPIESFLNVASHLGRLNFSRDTNFKIDEKPLVLAMDQLCKNGYAYKEENYYGWTDKAAPYMLDLYEWRENDANLRAVDPDFVKSQIHKLRGVKPNFNASQLMKFWDGENWLEEKLEEPVLSFNDAVAIVLCFAAENDDQHARELTSSFWP